MTLPTISVRGRLLLTFLVLTGVLLLPAVYAARQLAQLRDLAVGERGRHAAATLALGRFQARLSDLDRYARSYVAAPDEGLRTSMVAALDSLEAELPRLTDFGYGASADSLEGVVSGLQQRADTLTSLVQAGRLVEASEETFDDLVARIRVASELLDRVGETVDVRSRADFRRAREISEGSAWTTRAGVAGAFLLAAIMALWTTGALVRPLQRLRDGMADVGEGSFRAPEDLPYEREDEIGDLARSFRWMTGRLAELDRMKSEFVGVATHELKNPINVIQGYASLVGDGTLGPTSADQRNALRAVEEQTRILTRLVNRMLQISRLEAGAYPVHPQPTRPEELLESVRRSFAVLGRHKDIRVETEVEPSTPETVLMDPDVVREEVLGNLISNALKYTPEGGDIRVVSRGEEGWLVLEVSDSGPGIPQEKRARVFEKYVQADPADRDLGSGLGLAIAREIVETHGGDIALVDLPGRGAAFRIRLPLKGLESGRAAQAAEKTEPATRSG